MLRALHARVHGANADQAETLTRDVVLDVILRALADPLLRGQAFDTGQPLRPEEERAWSRSLLVYAAGFRGSARRLRSRSGSRLYLRMPSTNAGLAAVESWRFGAMERPVSLFGDLDFAGMQMRASLARFSRAQAPGSPAIAP